MVTKHADLLDRARLFAWHMQHVGRHEQDRFDAREWLKAYDGQPCECYACKKLERRDDLRTVAERTEVTER
jgi:hypothetical protein